VSPVQYEAVLRQPADYGGWRWRVWEWNESIAGERDM